MSNPILEISVTKDQIGFLISGKFFDEEGDRALEKLRKTLTSKLGILGEDFGEKSLPGSRDVKWDIILEKHEEKVERVLGLIVYNKNISVTYYTWGLHFSFPPYSLKFEDYSKVIKAFLSVIAVEKFDPRAVEKLLVVRAGLAGTFPNKNIHDLVNFILKFPPSSPVLTAVKAI